MDKRKKWLIAGLACLMVFGITVPVIASNVQGQNVRLEQGQRTQNEEANQRKAAIVQQAVQTVSVKNMEVSQVAEAEDHTVTDQSAEIVDNVQANTVCPYYVDVNGDGICDHCAHNGSCNNYVDANGDGACDYCAHNNNGNCGNYADANGDGVCDHCTSSGNGSGICAYYTDADGDGICDHCTNGGNGSGNGHHRDSHHSGGRNHH